MERTITVKGTGTIKETPDLIQMIFMIVILDQEYRLAYEAVGKQTAELIELLTGLGFSEAALKTRSFEVLRKVETQQTGEQWQEVFLGYEVHQSLLLEFDFDQKLLLNLMGKIAASNTNATVEINFTLADREMAEAKMLAEAATNARAKAEVLANTSGVKLGELRSINYDGGATVFRSETNFQPLRGKALLDAMPAFQPLDIEMKEQAIFTWKLKEQV